MPEDSISRDDFRRLEDKITELARSIERLILLEERQNTQGKRIGDLEQRMAADEAVTNKLEKNVSSWINRGIGVWSLAVAILALSNSKVILSFFMR